MVDSLSVSDVESKYPSVDGLFFLSFCFVGRNQANDHKCNRAGNAGEESTKRRQRNTKPAENYYGDAGNRSSNSSLSIGPEQQRMPALPPAQGLYHLGLHSQHDFQRLTGHQRHIRRRDKDLFHTGRQGGQTKLQGCEHIGLSKSFVFLKT